MGLDLSGYTQLVLDDRSPQDLVDAALQAYRRWLPGVDLAEGHVEAVLVEAFALQIAELLYALNRVPGQVAEGIIGIAGVARDPGAPPACTVEVVAATGVRVESAGIRVALDLPDERPLVLLTDPVVVPAGQASAQVAAAATGPTSATSAANGTPAGTALVLLDRVAGAERVTVATEIAGGRDPETTPALLDRGVARLARLADVLVLPKHFTAAAVEDVRVGNAATVDAYDPAVAGGQPGQHPGHVAVALLDTAGAPLAAAAADDVVAALADPQRSAAHLRVHRLDATVTAVPVAVTVRGRPSHTDAQVTAAVTAAVTARLDPLTWPWEPTVHRLDLVAAVDAAEGVARVEQVLLGGAEADYALPGAAPAPTPGAVTVTVNR